MTASRPVVEVVARVATPADAAHVRAFRCSGRRPRYAETAQKLIRRCGSVLAGDVRGPAGFRCLLFEGDDALVGLSAMQAADGACDWIVMGVATSHQGAATPDGRSLAVAIGDETIGDARRQGYARMVAMAHRDHATSRHILGRLDFVRVAAVDVDYDLFAVVL